jgi:hypothetical protein
MILNTINTFAFVDLIEIKFKSPAITRSKGVTIMSQNLINAVNILINLSLKDQPYKFP